MIGYLKAAFGRLLRNLLEDFWLKVCSLRTCPNAWLQIWPVPAAILAGTAARICLCNIICKLARSIQKCEAGVQQQSVSVTGGLPGANLVYCQQVGIILHDSSDMCDRTPCLCLRTAHLSNHCQ